jgi:NAD(P)-dependent dehydrogenase (short-subunit alcohol dehydrogenase family)
MNALVTGGAEGIGAAIVELLLQKGYQVYVLDLQEKQSNRPDLFYFTCDIADEGRVHACMARVPDLDLVVNNAAYQTSENLFSFSHEHWKRTIDVNLNGTFYVTQESLGHLKPGGQILIMGSIHGSVPRLGKYAYDASKAALEMMTKEFAGALADRGIRVNMVEVGATYTTMNASFQSDDQERQSAQEKVPLDVILKPEDVAKVVVALTQSDFRYMTGSVFVYDGGRALGIYPIETTKENSDLPLADKGDASYQHDVFIAYHGSSANNGSYSKAVELKRRLSSDYGFDCFLFDVGQQYDYKKTPYISARSRAVVFVVNENIKRNVDGSLLSQDIKNELAAYTGDTYIIFCTGTMHSKEADNIDSRSYKSVAYAECEFVSFAAAVEAVANRLKVALRKKD